MAVCRGLGAPGDRKAFLASLETSGGGKGPGSLKVAVGFKKIPRQLISVTKTSRWLMRQTLWHIQRHRENKKR